MNEAAPVASRVWTPSTELRATWGMTDGSQVNRFPLQTCQTECQSNVSEVARSRGPPAFLVWPRTPPTPPSSGLQRPGVAACEFSVSQQAHGEDKGAIEEAITEQRAAQDTLTEPPPVVPSPPFVRTTDTVFFSSPLPPLSSSSSHSLLFFFLLLSRTGWFALESV